MIKHVAVFTLLLVVTIGIVSAQVECPELVQQAISVMDDVCQDIERNQACYGNGRIDLQPQPNVRIVPFDSPGDMVAIVAIDSLVLSELNASLNEWGVALLSIQANLPETLPGQNVAVLLFGNSAVINAGEAMEAFYFSSGVGQSNCKEASDGLLIQSPEGDDVIELAINGVEITFGSTAYITAEHEGLMTFALLEGHATLTAEEETVSLVAGEFSTIELDENLVPISPPSAPQAIEENLILPNLPLSMLPRDISTEEDATGRINPISGNWAYTRNTIEASAGCPAMIVDMMENSMGMNQTDFQDFGGDDFNFETWFMSNTDGEMGGGDFSEPELNTHHYEAVIEGTFVVFELHVVSSTEVTGYMLFDISEAGMDCQITVPFAAEVVP